MSIIQTTATVAVNIATSLSLFRLLKMYIMNADRIDKKDSMMPTSSRYHCRSVVAILLYGKVTGIAGDLFNSRCSNVSGHDKMSRNNISLFFLMVCLAVVYRDWLFFLPCLFLLFLFSRIIPSLIHPLQPSLRADLL